MKNLCLAGKKTDRNKNHLIVMDENTHKLECLYFFWCGSQGF